MNDQKDCQHRFKKGFLGTPISANTKFISFTLFLERITSHSGKGEAVDSLYLDFWQAFGKVTILFGEKCRKVNWMIVEFII